MPVVIFDLNTVIDTSEAAYQEDWTPSPRGFNNLDVTQVGIGGVGNGGSNNQIGLLQTVGGIEDRDFGNFATFLQQGDDNQAAVSQVGNFDSGFNRINSDQIGFDNKLGVTQETDGEGNSNQLDNIQNGSNNQAYLAQTTTDGDNSADIEQDGNNNILAGADNSGAGVALDIDNPAQQNAQLGNTLLLKQFGYGNEAGLWQESTAVAGANEATILQTGNGNQAFAHQDSLYVSNGLNIVQTVQP
jgi:hypothetical protein